MAEAVTVTWPQDSALNSVALNAKQIVPVNIEKLVYPDSPLAEQLWLGAWSIAYLVIEYTNVDNPNNTSYDRFGLKYLHLLTPQTSNLILSLFGINSYGGYAPFKLGINNPFRINCNNTSINANCTVGSTINITFIGHLLIME